MQRSGATSKLSGLFLLSSLLLSASLLAQAPGGPGQSAAQSGVRGPDLRDALSAEDRALFDGAGKAFQQGNFAEAGKGFRQVLPHLAVGGPLQLYAAKMASEAALNTGDPAFALATLKPIFDANANDWQAASLLARCYAERGEKPLRDQMIARIVDLHKRATDAQIAKLQAIPLEQVRIPNGKVTFWYSLEPWGHFNTYLMARIYNSGGEQTYRIAVESSDADQAFIEKKVPGGRRFSLDGYTVPKKNADGGWSGSQALLGFFDGTFDYDEQKEKILKLAEEHSKPLATTQTAR